MVSINVAVGDAIFAKRIRMRYRRLGGRHFDDDYDDCNISTAAAVVDRQPERYQPTESLV